MKATVSEKGQVTIPKRLRERLGIRAGQMLDFEEPDGIGRTCLPRHESPVALFESERVSSADPQPLAKTLWDRHLALFGNGGFHTTILLLSYTDSSNWAVR